MSSMKEKILKLPQTPGIYIFKNKNGKILYIGKATSLRSRVNSYFSGIRDPRIVKMVSQIADMKIQKTESVLEALILEANLIKKYQPKYNVKERDDKSFCYFVITKEKFPRVLIVRKTDLFSPHPSLRATLSPNRERRLWNADKIFGPYTSKKQMEIALKIIRKIFPFHSNNAKTEKGCLDFQMGRCPGPYAGIISKKDYRKNIRGIKMILKGKKKNLVRKLEKEMKVYAEQHEYERATEIRNKIFSLKHIRDVALLTGEMRQEISYKKPEIRIEAYDISDISGQHATGSMVVFTVNKPDKSQYRKFRIKTVKSIDDVGMMKEVLLRRFKNDWPKPDLILLDGGVGHLNMGIGVLEDLELEIPIAAAAKGAERKKINLRFKNYDLRKEIKVILKNQELVKQIMAEAHRFAIGYHRKLRKKKFLQ